MDELFLKPEQFEKIFKSNLKIETYSKSIRSLFKQRLLSKIIYDPYYQRNYVWDNHKASYFIESILLGTEIPPLIFFNSGSQIEVIDGRQRFETIKRFINDEFSLTTRGLFSLKQLSKLTYSSIKIDHPEIAELFNDAKLRIIEFEIVNEPELSSNLEDKIKKEIFARYNSGITPLKKPEIDNAVYDQEPISTFFKNRFKKNLTLKKNIYSTFFKPKEKYIDNPPIEQIMQFVRRLLVLSGFPIKYYARGTYRSELLTKYFDYLSDSTEDVNQLYETFIKKIEYILQLKKIMEEKNFANNHLVFECVLWGLTILEKEEKDLDEIIDDRFLNYLAESINNKLSSYSDQDYHYYKAVMVRFQTTSDIIGDYFSIPLRLYVDGASDKKLKIKDLRSEEKTQTKLEELESLRITKPDPSRNSIDDIIDMMQRDRYLIRPSYQRSEVINLPKASAIIESILLGIMLPAIFVFKREDGVYEVIDGQQRLLTLIGFLGEEYNDEDGKRRFSKNHKFNLQRLRILKEYNSFNFDKLSPKMQDKIYDFELFVVEIEQRLNPEFNPVDLFIRLNDKPYPIKENSFEMWNSWADTEVITKIKEQVKKISSWFYLKPTKRDKMRDRMENEEMFTILSYLFYKNGIKHFEDYVDIYQKGERINARIRDKKDVTSLLTEVSTRQDVKESFLKNIERVEGIIVLIKKFVSKIKNRDEKYYEVIDSIFKGDKPSRTFRRTLQEFYILFICFYSLSEEIIEEHYLEIKDKIVSLFDYMKNVPPEDIEKECGFDNFIDALNSFRSKFN